jgi:aminoglycoside phosphotransferase (APT) family kinase protein
MPRTPRAPTRTELHTQLGIDVGPLRPHPGGYEADAFTDGTWFVKVWRDGREVDVSLLDRLAGAGLPVPTAVGTALTDDGRRCAVFPFVEGRHATADDADEVARGLRCVHEVQVDELALPAPLLCDEPLVDLRSRLDHPWVRERADELETWLDRFERVLEHARATVVPHVLSHDDFGGSNVLLDGDGRIVAMLDWDWARLGPREHDLWLVIEEAQPERFLDAYGRDVAFDRTHLEFGLLRRALGDLAARVVDGVDRPGVTTWGFDRLARLDATLELFD